MRNDKVAAIQLRKGGKSYNEISRRLNIPKSTLSYWLKDKKFSYSLKQNLVRKSSQIWSENITRYNKNRAKIIKDEHLKNQLKIANNIKKLSSYELKLLGTALYWAEGGKRGNRFEFTNSDPEIIKIIILFLNKVCLVEKSFIKIQLGLHQGIDGHKAKNYWHRLTGIPLKNFYKITVNKNIASKGRRPKNRLPYGTIQLKVHDVKLFDKILGWIQGISRCAI